MATDVEAPPRRVTAEELLAMPDDGLRRELVQGEVRTMTPAGHTHGWIAVNVTTSLAAHVRANRLGRVYAAETGFRVATDPDTVRAPDAAFVAEQRVRAAGDSPGFWPGAPDLAVEVVSPSDTFARVEEKVFDWLGSGTRMVVVVNPEKQTVTVFRSRSQIVLLAEDDVVDGGDVVPGWQLPVRDIFTP